MSRQSTFLIKPYDHILVRQNPIYSEPCFVMEKLNKDLSLNREAITSKHIPEANNPEEFLRRALAHPHMETKRRKSILKLARKPVWVKVTAGRHTPVAELWKMAMGQLGENNIYQLN